MSVLGHEWQLCAQQLTIRVGPFFWYLGLAIYLPILSCPVRATCCISWLLGFLPPNAGPGSPTSCTIDAIRAARSWRLLETRRRSLGAERRRRRRLGGGCAVHRSLHCGLRRALHLLVGGGRFGGDCGRHCTGTALGSDFYGKRPHLLMVARLSASGISPQVFRSSRTPTPMRGGLSIKAHKGNEDMTVVPTRF